MKVGTIAMVGWLLVAAGSALAGPVKEVQYWATQGGATGVVSRLVRWGITNAADQAAIVAAWDEDVIVDVTLRVKAYGLVADMVRCVKLSPASMQKIKETLAAEKNPPGFGTTVEIVRKYPVAAREAFRAMLEKTVVPALYYATPEYGRLYLKYSILRDDTVQNAAGIDELSRLLLAPEQLTLGSAQVYKLLIKDRAVRLARLQLRAEGKTFVIKNGVNPLVAKVEPVVVALNAAECKGLEAAVRALGTEMADVDRAALQKVAAQWRAGLLRGDLGDENGIPQYLGKLAVALGVEGYGAFVDEYNNGTGAK